MTLPEALVFDFDGLLVDTEWSIYEMAAHSFATFGVDLDVASWAAVIGHGDDADQWSMLAHLHRGEVDEDAWNSVYDSLDRSVRDHLPIQPGVVDLLDGCDAAGVAVGIASSSDRAWIAGHLQRLGLLDRFATIAGFDRTRVGKPAPDCYLLACADLGADPARSVALEDAAPGLVAARAAGMVTVAVPSRITAHSDLTGADLTVASLTDLTVERLGALVAARPPTRG